MLTCADECAWDFLPLSRHVVVLSSGQAHLRWVALMGMQRYSHDPLAGEQGPVTSPVISGGRAEGRERRREEGRNVMGVGVEGRTIGKQETK